ncbi:EF-hand domain-containing protein [Sphingomonas gilva]|uniref:EF-hand domain-containing protein n=1 Tax=Sphingomonas gilva TaxID=2305907 RepID=A0A396RKJ8_9SPHN|nr:EF-hand domain-containing protein [Sphingomonas gilva]RHW16589.1 EF-hand domain-containing protein [Sphingomonas gilva]
MLKYALLASALAIGAPAIAQDMTTPAPQQQAPTQTAPQTDPMQQAPQAQPATPDTTASAPTEQAPAAGPAQVAEVVKAEFPTYDKDSSGSLSDTEFASWMGALRKASEPTVDTESAEVKTWIEGAFASADTDKDKAVTEGELTTFLTAGQPS